MTRRQWDALLPIVAFFFFSLGAAATIFILLLAGIERETLVNTTNQAGWLLALPLFLLILTGWLINRWVQGYRFAAEQLAEEVELIAAANPSYRVSIKGPSAMPQLGVAINELAIRIQHVLANQQQEIEQYGLELITERNRLATLMADLSEGVVVCNQFGHILLYNPSAHHLLTSTENSTPEHFLGLGRSIFLFLEESTLRYALKQLHTRIARENNEKQSFRFVVTTTQSLLLRGNVAPVLDIQKDMVGFILTLEDITEMTRQRQQRDALLYGLIEDIRPALTNLRAAIETIEDYPQMSINRLQAFQSIIGYESKQLSNVLENTVAQLTDLADLPTLQSEPILSHEFLTILQQALQDQCEIQVELDSNNKLFWLQIDSHALSQALSQSAKELKREVITQTLHLRSNVMGRFAALDLCWVNSKPVQEALQRWQSHDKCQDYQKLVNLIRQYGGELWCQTDEVGTYSFLRLLLPTTSAPSRPNLLRSNSSEQETFYDFNLLFQPSPETLELHHCNLTSLTYTVFDTETTGLNPSQGDEIVSIGAVRIVNGRLLTEERFEQLVDPRRSIPREATAIHHITEKMVQGQPVIEQVLPRFFRFTENTVLVAHNAAFDMRMFQVKEEATGITFTQPLLDTLLLSALLHPKQERHTLEEIAYRFGIPVSNRHTALGDASLTAQIFLKFIPLLAAKGITTLQQAHEAAQQTYYASIQY